MIKITKNNPTQIDGFTKETRTIAGIDDDNFASHFQLDEHYEDINNTLNIPTYKTPYGTTMFNAKKHR